MKYEYGPILRHKQDIVHVPNVQQVDVDSNKKVTLCKTAIEKNSSGQLPWF